MNNNLLLFSGGADSVYVAYKLLETSKEDLTLFILCSETTAFGLKKNDLIKLQPLLNELRKYGRFRVVYHKIEENKINSWEVDRWLNYSILVLADDLNSGRFQNIICGTTWEQVDASYFKNSSVRGISPIIDGPNFFDKHISNGKLWFPLIDNTFHENFNRLQLIKNIPSNLMELCLTDTSKQYINDKVKSLISQGYTSTDFDNWRHEKNREYGGGKRDLSYTYWIRIIDGQDSFSAKKGVATDGLDLNFDIVTNKQQCIDWYTNIEYNPVIDYCLLKWNEDKTAFKP